MKDRHRQQRQSSPLIVAEPYQRAAREGLVAGEGYDGLRVHALPGLHAEVSKHLRTRAQPGSRVLDVGAGSGALSARLRDMGYDVTACDFVTENFRARDVEFIQADLNARFADGIEGMFDAIVAVEVVEHLENPRHLVRECSALLKPGGCLLLTTPNVDGPASLALWLRTGNPQWFSDDDYASEGHIMPVPFFLLRWLAREAGLEIDEVSSFGSRYGKIAASWWKLRLMTRILDRLMTPEIPRGEILISVFRRPMSRE